jgi:hypothetical protein
MKQFDEQRVFSFFTRRLATAGAVAILALIAASGAKAAVETFHFSGSVGTSFGSPLSFSGTLDLDFSNDFTLYAFDSLNISVHGRPVFTQVSSLPSLGTSVASIHATNSAKDMLTLTFAIPTPGAWIGFNQGAITGGQLVFGAFNGFYVGASGVVTRDPSDPLILAPPPLLNDPPPEITTAAVPELSTWAMMLIGLAGLGIAAKRRRALNVLSRRA